MQNFYGRLGIIGGGKMASALIQGLLAQGMKPDLILVSEPEVSRQAYLREEYQVRVRFDNSALAKEVDIVILAVKPQIMETVLEEISDSIKRKNPLVISIVAGIRLSLLSKYLGANARLVRVMPNTPALVREGISAFVAGPGLKKGDRGLLKAILSIFGKEVELEKEELMDAVTGLSGSGPAYIFMTIEALADGGVKMGLPRSLALTLASQTVLGAGKMVLETGKSPAELKDMVASPGGTTIEAISVLEQGGFRGLLIKAVEVATLRSKELANSLKELRAKKGGKR